MKKLLLLIMLFGLINKQYAYDNSPQNNPRDYFPIAWEKDTLRRLVKKNRTDQDILNKKMIAVICYVDHMTQDGITDWDKDGRSNEKCREFLKDLRQIYEFDVEYRQEVFAQKQRNTTSAYWYH